LLFEVCRDLEETTEVAGEAEIVEAAGRTVDEGEIVAECKAEVGPIEQVVRKFAAVDEIARVESAAGGIVVESEVDVALEEEVGGETVKVDADCWRECVDSKLDG
jgi:hypothetical protein